MSTLTHRLIRYIAVPVAFLWGTFGCGDKNGLPDEVTVTLPDGTEVAASIGSGAASLSNTTWDFYRAAPNGQTAVFVTISFGADGDLQRFDNNTIASGIFGDTIYFDGEQHPTAQTGLTYSAATYGAQTSDASGFSFAGRFTAFAAGLQAADGESSASGEFDADDPATMRGMFAFKTKVTLIDYPDGNQEDRFNFVAKLHTGE